MAEKKRYSNGYTAEQQRAATARFYDQVHRVGVQIPAAAWEQVEAYAAGQGLTVGACMKLCLSRCMEQDGAGQIPLTVSEAKHANRGEPMPGE